MPQLLPAAAAWAATAWTSAVTVTAGALASAGAVTALGEGATIALAGGLLKTGAMLAISAAATALLRPNVPGSGTTLDFKPDPKAPIRGAMGYTALGGNKVFQATWGYKKVAMSLGVALSLGPIDAVTQFQADGSAVAFTGAQNEATGFYAADMWQKTTLGLPGDTALLPPTGLKYGTPGLTGWGAQNAAPQTAFAFWTMVLAKNPEDRDVFTNGVPDPRWVGRWMKVWQPRKDSTYPGGNGPQRRDDWRTWGWSENPYEHALAWVRGHYKLNLDGSIDKTKRIAGVGTPDTAIDIPAFVEGMNVADANGWTISGEWTTSDPKWQVLVGMLQAGGGEPINRGAQISVLVNTPRVSTYTYTKADLIGAGSIKPLTPRRERKNTIVPRYRSEANGWEYVAAGEVSSETYRAEDRGEPRSTEVEYVYVRDAKQAGQLAAYDLANLREGLTTELPSKVHMMHIHPGDCITIDDAALSMIGQKVIVKRATTNYRTASVTLEVRSETDAKHAWALGQSDKAPPSPSLSAVDPKYIDAPVAADWEVVAKLPTGETAQPIIVIDGKVETSDVASIIIEYALGDGSGPTGPWTLVYSGAPSATGKYEAVGLNPGDVYWISIRYVAKNGATSERLVRGPATAGELIAGDVSPSAPTIVAMQEAIDAAETGIASIDTAVASLNATIYTAGTGLKARSDAMYADINTATTGLKARSDAMFADINTASTGLKAQTASLLASLNTPTTGVLARLTTVENSSASNNSAAVNRLNALEATVNTAGTGLSARLATAENAIVTNRDAAATRLSALEATVNTAGTGLSAKVSGLQSAVTDLQTGKANASDLSLLQTEVTTARGSAASLNARLNTVESNVAGKASSQSVTALESSVAVRNRTFRQTTAPTSPANGYPLIAGDRWINTTSGQNNAESAWSGSAWVSITDPRIAAADQGVTDLTAKIGSVSGTVADALAGKASAQALTDLTTRVTSAEGVNTAQNTRLSTVESDVAGKASSARVTALEATVNTAGTGLSARMATQETATANLQTNKADASRVTALEARSETVMAAAISLMPSTPAAELWTNQGTNGAPLSRPSLPASAVVNGAYVQASIAGPKQHLPWRDGAIFDLVSTVFNPNAGAASFRHHVQRFDASYQAVGGNAGSTTSVPAGVTTTITSRFGMGVAVAGGTQLTRSGAEWLSVNATNNLTSGAPLQVQSLAAADVTDATAISSVAARMATQEGAVADLQAGKADASRVTALEATVNTAGTGLSARVAGLQTAVGDLQTGKASASDLTALTARVTSAEGVNTAQNTRLTSAETEIGKRALATDVTALAARVTTAESDNSARNTRLNTVESDVAGKASASSVADLQATLHTAGTGLLARMGTSENAIVNLQTGKADASRVTSLEATINTAGTGLSARLTNVESVAASADGTAKSIKGFVQDVNGYVSGFSSINNGLVAQIEFLADNFGIRSPGSGERTEYRAGNWYVYSPTEGTRTRYGKAFGGTQKLTWWAGPDTVAEGSETKANAYVYMSQNTVGGPRFGGSDVPVAGSGTAAAGRGAVSGSISNTTFATVASVTFTGRPASGFWTAAVSGLSASASGVDANMEFRVIEQGASTALASGFTVVPGGGATTLVDLSLSPAGLLAQTRPAGSITLNLQARRTAGSGAVTISGGDFNVTYTPSA